MGIGWVAVWAWADPSGGSTCGDASSAARLGDLAPTALQRETEEAWRASAKATCAWATRLPEADACATALCASGASADRLASLASAPSADARAADLLRTTGRWCDPAEGPACAVEAQVLEDDRLAAMVDVLSVRESARSTARGWSPALREAQRTWFAYRDALCDAVAVLSDDDVGWSRAACGAAMSARRTALLARIAEAGADEVQRERIDRIRLAAAAREVRPRGRPWEDWVDLTGAEVSDLLRELVEARADGALFPPIVSTRAFERCAPPYRESTCWSAVRAETQARRDAAVAAMGDAYAEADLAEEVWRVAWCRGAPPDEVDACEAGIDLVIAEALRGPGAGHPRGS